jgi:hypothetical protein
MSLILKKTLSLQEKSMTHNTPLELSLQFREQLHQDLFPVTAHDFPQEAITSYMEEKNREKSTGQKPRDKVHTVSNTLFTVLLTSVQEDKSMQQSVNLFRQVYEERGSRLLEAEAKKIEEEQAPDKLSGSRTGRPKLYKSKLPKSKTIAEKQDECIIRQSGRLLQCQGPPST